MDIAFITSPCRVMSSIPLVPPLLLYLYLLTCYVPIPNPNALLPSCHLAISRYTGDPIDAIDYYELENDHNACSHLRDRVMTSLEDLITTTRQFQVCLFLLLIHSRPQIFSILVPNLSLDFRIPSFPPPTHAITYSL